jgi:hypothetical protein
LAADSQETVPVFDGNQWVEYRKTVQKIIPRDMGSFSVVVAGTGNAELIDSFILVLGRKLANPAEQTLNDFVECAEDDRYVKMLFAAAPKNGGEPGVWIQKHVRLSPVTAPELIGFEESIYFNMLMRLCGDKRAIQQGILAALYVLTMAEQTSNSVRGPMEVIVIRQNGIWPEGDAYVANMTERLRLYEQQLNSIFLACADTSISPKTLEFQIADFATKAMALHAAQIQRVAQMQVDSGLYIVNDSHPRLPPGTELTIPESGPITAQCDVPIPEWYQQAWARVQELEAAKQSAAHTSEEQRLPCAEESPEIES